MAKSPLQIKTKKKAPRVTKNAEYMANLKFYGEEPSLKGKVSDILIMRAFTWYNYMCEPEDAREYIIEYLKANKQETLIKKFRRVPLNRIPTTYAWVYRMSMRGTQFDSSILEKAKKSIEASFSFMEEEVKEEKKIVEKPSIQERIAEKVSEFIGEVESIIDNTPEGWSMYKHLQTAEFPAKLTTKVLEYYKPFLEELTELLNNGESQLKEAYSHLSKPKLRERIALFQMIVDDCNRYAGNLRKQKAPRKKKAQPADKVLKFFQYQKESNEHKLQSVSPESILGAQELWVFNTKYNILSVFRAIGPAGLNVKRTAITGFDSESSVSKRIGRTTEETLKKVLSGGKIVLRRLMDEIKSDPVKISDRINNNVILVKTVR